MFEYSNEDGIKLLKLARESIKEEFTDKKPEMLKEGKFQEKRGVFVTLHKNNELRGCIGFPYPNLPLTQAIYQAAKNAAFSDYRFFPLTKEELKKVKIEISILTVPRQCKVNEVEIGKDGLICQFQGMSGLLLPQVAVEYKMSRQQFIEALCNKAGLPKDAYKEKEFKLYKFQAQIFSE